MICKCGESGVLNEVLNQQFYYCRVCKVEISLEEPPSILSGSSEVVYLTNPLLDFVAASKVAMDQAMRRMWIDLTKDSVL